MYVSKMKQFKLFVNDYIYLTFWGACSGAIMYYTWKEFEISGGVLNHYG